MASGRRPTSKIEVADSSDSTWLYLVGGAVLAVGVGAAYFLLSSSPSKPAAAKSASSKPAASKSAKKPAGASASSGEDPSAPEPVPAVAAPPAETPAPAPAPARAPAPAPASASASASGEEADPADEEAPLMDMGSAPGAGIAATPAIEYGPDGTVTKASLVTILSSLTDRVAERREALKAAVEAGHMDSSEFQRGLADAIPEIETAVNEEFGVEPQAVFKAQTMYQEDPEVVAISRKLRDAALPDFASKAMGDMEEIIGGDGTVPDDMTAARVAEMTRANARATIAKMKELVAEVKADGLPGQEAMQAFQTRFIERAKEFTLETFRELDISPEDYAACMIKFAEAPEVQEAHMETHNKLMMCQQLNMMELTTNSSRADAAAALSLPRELADEL